MEQFTQYLMESFGPFGVALLMFLENIFPPIPSEIVMPLAGYRAAQGDMSIWVVIISGTVGSLLGVTPWYVLGRWMGKKRLMKLAERHGRWMTMDPEDVERADGWFNRHGAAAVFFGRLIPTVRTLISVPAGIARMNLGIFLAFSAAGALLWTAILALLGFALGQAYDTVSAYVGPVSNTVVVLLVGAYIWRLVRFRKKHKGDSQEET